MKANRMNFLIWAFLVLCILVCFHFFSDGDFSFLLVCDGCRGFIP